MTGISLLLHLSQALKLFCCTIQINLLRNFYQKYNTALMGGRSVLILKSCLCYLVNSSDLQSTLVLCVNGTAGTGLIIGLNVTCY